MKNNGKPPKGMYVNHDDLVSLATGPSTQGEQLLKGMDREIVSFKRIVSKIRKKILFTLQLGPLWCRTTSQCSKCNFYFVYEWLHDYGPNHLKVN